MTVKNIGLMLGCGLVVIIVFLCWQFLQEGLTERGGQNEKAGVTSPIMGRDSVEQVSSSTEESKSANDKLSVSREILDIARSDISTAVNRIDAEHQGENRRLLRNLLAKDLCNRDLSNLQHLDFIVAAPDDRIGIATSVAALWAERQSGRLMSYIEGLPSGSLKSSLIAGCAIRFATMGRFIEVPALVEKMPFGQQRTEVISRVVNNYKGPMVDLTDWVASLPLAEDRLSAETGLYMVLSQDSSIEGLFHLAKSSQNPNIRSKAFCTLGALVGKNDPNRILLMAQDPNIGEIEKGELLAGAVGRLSVAKGIEVVSITSSWKDNQARGRVLSEYVGRLLIEDPMAAVAFTNGVSLADDEYVTKGLVSKWYKTDSEALSDWINQLPQSNKKDTALTQLSYMMKKSDPELARKVAGQIANDEIRKRALGFIK